MQTRLEAMRGGPWLASPSRMTRACVAVEQRCECRRIQVWQRFGVLMKHRGNIGSVDLILLAVQFFHQFIRRAVEEKTP